MEKTEQGILIKSVSDKPRAYNQTRRVGVLLLEPGAKTASMISARAVGVQKVLWESERAPVGKTWASGHGRDVVDAQRIARDLADVHGIDHSRIYEQGIPKFTD